MKTSEKCGYSNIEGYLPGMLRSCNLSDEINKVFHGKNKRVICPICGRKMWAARRTCHDGCCIIYCVPPHKKKGWWKKPKRQSRDTKIKRR